MTRHTARANESVPVRVTPQERAQPAPWAARRNFPAIRVGTRLPHKMLENVQVQNGIGTMLLSTTEYLVLRRNSLLFWPPPFDR